MRKLKLFSLALMALFSTSLWADETYYLQDPDKTNGTPELTGDFYTTAALSFTVNKAYSEVTYKKGLTFDGNLTSIGSNCKNPGYQVRYDCKTNDTEVTVLMYATNTSKNITYYTIQEAALGSACTVSNLSTASATNGSISTKTISIKNSTRTSLYLSVNDKGKCTICQIIVVEKGTKFPAPCEAGYSINFNKGRYIGTNGSIGKLDTTATESGVEMCMSMDYYGSSSTTGKFQTKGTNYIKFKVATPMVLNFTTSSTAQYNVSKTKGSDTDKITPTANTAKQIKLTSAGTWYINPQGSAVTPTGMTFSAAPVVSYNGNGAEGTMDPTYFTVAANGFTAPASSAFVGWNTQADGKGTAYAPDDEVTENVTLYAQWATSCAVKFYTGYDPNTQIGSTQNIGSGAYAEAPADPSRSGYQFLGWSYDATKAHIVNVASYAITDATNFTAMWGELFAITEGSHTNGSITIDPTSAIEGATITLTATPNFKYVFGAWSITKTSDGSATGITVDGNNQFEMPGYAVTVSATFTADSRKQILYLTSAATTNDKMYAALNSVDDYNVIVEAPNAQTLTNYDLVVLHESITGDAAKSSDESKRKQVILDIPTTTIPVLNTKSYFYTSARWNWGSADAGKSIRGAKLNTEYCNIADHPIFDGLTFVGSDSMTLFSSAKAKAMQPITSFVSGKAGYTLATSPKNSGAWTDRACAIHELTPAQRGVVSGKYLMISIGNENDCFSKLNDNGQRLIKNAAAYLLSDETWTPKTLEVSIDGDIDHGSVDVDIDCAAEGDEITLSNTADPGYKLAAYDVYKTGESATKVSVTSAGKFTMPDYPVTVSATFALTYAVTYAKGDEGASGEMTDPNAPYIAGAEVTLLPNAFTAPEGKAFKEWVVTPTAGGDAIEITAGKFTMPAEAVTVTATWKDNGGETGIDDVANEIKAVKFFENGQLLIRRGDKVYDAQGQLIR